MDALLKVSHNMPVGTMAFVSDLEYAYLRVKDGWRYIEVWTMYPIHLSPVSVYGTYLAFW